VFQTAAADAGRGRGSDRFVRPGHSLCEHDRSAAQRHAVGR
jgi:hypothetical protein